MSGAEREYGEVFTRRWVVESILDLIGYTEDADLATKRLLEPSSGSGAFIVPIIERLLASAEIHGRTAEDMPDAIIGVDVQEAHVEVCRAKAENLLTNHGINKETAEQLAKTWFRTADFLLDDIVGGVDFVVGNPPYIRADDLDDDIEAAYRSRWETMRGRADIYVGFYERSLGLLSDGGRVGFICADRWMRNAYGKRLRGLVSSRYAVEHVWQMHDVDAFEAEVAEYPAITVLANTKQGEVTLVDTTAKFDALSAREVLDFTRSDATEGHGIGWEGAKLPSWFETDDFWPAGKPHVIKVLEDLAERFPTLEADGRTRVGIGVATGADKAYLVSADDDVDVETDRLLPIVMADDIRGGTLEKPKKVMLNPWAEDGSLIDLSLYPRLAGTLEKSEAVRNRFVAKRNPQSWHRTIDKVVPGLAERPKLLLQDMKMRITPVLEPGGLYPHHNLYYIVSATWDLEVLGGLLMSNVAESFVAAYGVKMRGGTLRFQAQYLRKIAVPAPDSLDEEVARELRDAFRNHDREAATRAAEAAYGLPAGTI